MADVKLNPVRHVDSWRKHSTREYTHRSSLLPRLSLCPDIGDFYEAPGYSIRLHYIAFVSDSGLRPAQRVRLGVENPIVQVDNIVGVREYQVEVF